MIELFVQVKFKEITKFGEYVDAIYYPYTDFPDVKDSDIQSIIDERVANYVKVVSSPPEVIEPTKEELMLAKADLMAQVAELDSKIAEKK